MYAIMRMHSGDEKATMMNLTQTAKEAKEEIAFMVKDLVASGYKKADKKGWAVSNGTTVISFWIQR